MARGVKRKGEATDAPTSVTITYDLFELPTAQHKAGLAGLLLQIDSMTNRGRPAPTYRWDEEQPSSKVHIEFTAETLQLLFDDLYAAEVVAEWSRSKKQKEQLKDEKTNELRGTKVKLYLYDVVRPTLPALRHRIGTNDAAVCWIKLWQDMLWGVPRGVNTTRIPFEVVAGWSRKQTKEARKVPPRPCPEGVAAWGDLTKYVALKSDGKPPLDELDGKLWLGAQKTNAERIKFQGPVEYNLLLHFWPLATLVYVPQSFKVVREQGRVEAKRRYDGFAVVIPDIADLPTFNTRFQETLHELSREPMSPGGRPQSAVVELPAQGAVSLVDRERASGLVQQRAGGSEFRFSITGVEYLHFRPGKNGPKMLSAGRMTLRPHLAEDYEMIAGRPGGKPPFANALFRRGLMLALLESHPWHQPFGKIFSEWPSEFFVPSEKSPQRLSWFWADARKKLQEVIKSMPTDAQPTDPPPESDDVLASTVNGLVRRYLDERLKKDAGYDFAKYRVERDTPQAASEDRRKLAERLFLEFRSRRDQAFVSHFSGTIFSVGQYLGNRPVNKLFEKVADALIHRTDDVKTLTLMALSANSWVPMKKKETAQ